MMHAFFQFVNIFDRGNEAVETVGHDIRAALARSDSTHHTQAAPAPTPAS